jgi:hypothetical protein
MHIGYAHTLLFLSCTHVYLIYRYAFIRRNEVSEELGLASAFPELMFTVPFMGSRNRCLVDMYKVKMCFCVCMRVHIHAYEITHASVCLHIRRKRISHTLPFFEDDCMLAFVCLILC